MSEIFSKWVSPKHKVASTESGEFYKMDTYQFGTLMLKEVHAGSLHYRLPKETERVSRKQLIETVIERTIQIHQLPF